MKRSIISILLTGVSFCAVAQISGIPVTPPAPQAVPNAVTTEKSAAPQKQNIAPTARPVPPVYQGASTEPVVMPRELVYPAAPPAPTQPQQREPLTPVESTNNLQPNRVKPDEASRENAVNGRPAAVIPDNRVNKNELRAAGTVENVSQMRNNTVVFPARTDTVKKVFPPPIKKKKKQRVKS